MLPCLNNHEAAVLDHAPRAALVPPGEAEEHGERGHHLEACEGKEGSWRVGAMETGEGKGEGGRNYERVRISRPGGEGAPRGRIDKRVDRGPSGEGVVGPMGMQSYCMRESN